MIFHSLITVMLSFSVSYTVKAVLVVVCIVHLHSNVVYAQQKCINTYNDLKRSLRRNHINIQDMINVFYPPNESTNHVVNVYYCMTNTTDNTTNIEDQYCNQTFSQYHFQWLVNSLPILTDSDVLRANTFNLASLKQNNLTLQLQSFCEDANELLLLETLTVWLKSYAMSDEETIEAYCVFLTNDNENKSADAFRSFGINNGTLTLGEAIQFDTRKFLIGLWLGITSLTVAMILHVGRYSIKTANTMNQVLWDVTQALNQVMQIPQAFLSVLKVAKYQDKKATEEKMKENDEEAEEMTLGDKIPDEQLAEPSIINDIEMKEITHKLDNDDHTCISLEEQTDSQDKSPLDNLASSISTEVNLESIVLKKATEKIEKKTGIKNKNDLQIVGGKHTNKTSADIDHAFALFSKQIRKSSTTSIILLMAFIAYDAIVYFAYARKDSYDWFILFPFPLWFSIILVINLMAFFITEILLACCKTQSNREKKSCAAKLFTLFVNFFTVFSATTLPMFIFFHLFWLAVASSLFATRIASSFVFYIPLVIAIYWFLAITSWMLQEWKKLITRELKSKTKMPFNKKLGKAFRKIMESLAPYLFLPFWILLLTTLNIFSSYLNNIVDLEDQNLLVVFGVIFTIIGITKKIADHCKPKIDDGEDTDNATPDNE